MVGGVSKTGCQPREGWIKRRVKTLNSPVLPCTAWLTLDELVQLQCCSAASARADLVPCSALLCSALFRSAQLGSAQLSSSHLCSRSVCISAFCSVRLQYKGESQLIARPSPIGTTTARQRAKKQHRVCLALGLGGAWTALHCPKSLQALGPSRGHLATLSRPSSSPLAWVCL